jgi:hypothetical protein
VYEALSVKPHSATLLVCQAHSRSTATPLGQLTGVADARQRSPAIACTVRHAFFAASDDARRS